MPSSPASRRAANRCWILVFKIGLFTKCSIGQRQSIAPGARGKVFGLFPFTGVLHQKTKGAPPAKIAADVVLVRSEEHTSELQSRSDLVCRLLLEKKIYNFFSHHYIYILHNHQL